MYTYWRRTLPPPTMMAFNAAARDICIVRTDRTITPLQALTMMNNKTFVEAARFLAERMLRQHPTPDQRVAWAFRLVTSRTARPDELSLLLADLRAFRRDFVQDPEAAKKLLATGQKQRDRSLDAIEVAAYALVANTIMNLDESIIAN
jgi:hypothetical protein